MTHDPDLMRRLAALRMRFSLMIVTPDMARDWLAGNQQNRKLRETMVQRYALDLKVGRWLPTHQGIALTETGRLLDGQHRLTAILRTGISAILLVAFDVPDEAFEKLDRGAIRSTADALQQDQRAIACARLLYTLATGRGSYLVTDEDVATALSAFDAEIKKVIEAIPSALKVLGSAPVRAAAALRLAVGEREAFVTETLQQFVTNDQRMPPIAWATRKQIVESRISVRKDAAELFLKVWKMLDESQSHRQIARLNPTERANLLTEVGDLIAAKLPGKTATIAPIKSTKRRSVQ